MQMWYSHWEEGQAIRENSIMYCNDIHVHVHVIVNKTPRQ